MSRMILTFVGVAVFIVLCWMLALYYNKKTTNLDEYLVSAPGSAACSADRPSPGTWATAGSSV